MTDWTPVAATEWDEAQIKDCAWASILMLLNKGTYGKFPTNRANREALARAAGKAEGHEAATTADLVRGAKVRYGLTLHPSAMSGPRLIDALKPGVGAAVMGYYSAAPSRLTRFDRAFAARGRDSYHCVYAECRADGSLWWIDPLFHDIPGTREADYKGEPILAAELSGFATAFRTSAKFIALRQGSLLPPGAAGPVQEDDVSVTVLYKEFPVPRAITIAKGQTITGYHADSSKPPQAFTFKAGGTVPALAEVWITRVPDDGKAPHGGPFLHIGGGSLSGLVIVESQVVLAPAPPAVSAAQYAAQGVALKAALDRLAAVRKAAG